MKLSYRIQLTRYEAEEQFQQLLEFLNTHRDCVDELTLFTEYWHHGYYPLEAFEKLCQIMGNRIEQLRSHGFKSVGINMLVTLGHTPEAWDWLPALPYQAATGWDGTQSTSSFCPNSAEFRKYIARKYTLTALAKPDFIWVDDDVRMFGIGVEYACFCPECLRIYNNKYQTDYSREQLADLLNSRGAGLQRERWVQQNIDTIERLLSHIAEAVHRVDPSIGLGLMTVSLGISTYTGADFKKWFAALESVKARPGGGFFDDSKPFGFIRKIHEVNRQIAHYPVTVQDIQYELENFPYNKLSKSIHIMMMECTASVVSGTRGIAFNALKGEEGSLEEFHEVMNAIQASKPLWSEMDRIAGDYRSAGLFPAMSALYEARRSVENGKWFEGISVDSSMPAYVMSEIGIPLTMHGNEACGTILSGNMAEGYTTDELRMMLSRGVLIDGRTLEVLTAKGLGAFCGVTIERTYDNGVFERFTNDPLNNGNQGENRDARNSMSKEKGYVLKPLYAEVRVLSRLISYTKADLGPASTVYENALGGRVAVQGYVPWFLIHSAVKRTQLLQICDWLSYGRLPIVIDRCIKVVPFIKHSQDSSRWFVMLLNASFDETSAFVARLRYSADNGPIFELLADGSSILLPESAYELYEGEVAVSIDNIGSWKCRMFYQS